MPALPLALWRALRRILRIPGQLLISWIDKRKAQNGIGPLNTFQRGFVHWLVWFVGFVMVLVATTEPTPRTSTLTARSAPTTTTAAAPTSAAPTTTLDSTSVNGRRMPPAAASGEPATVANVLDGDTFDLIDGERVRVIGIDSCEKNTPGGKDALAAAERLLLNIAQQQVFLVREPGVERDHHGRLLRYVILSEPAQATQSPGVDFGLEMILWDHTGIYTDKSGRQGGDASQEYLERMRAKDLAHASSPPAGRECGEEPPPPPATSGGDDGDVHIDLPDNDDDHHHRGWRPRRLCKWNPLC